MTDQATGFEALSKFNAFLSKYGETWLRKSYQENGEIHRHYSVAYGNEAVPAKQLSVEQGFFGDIHGKIRSLVGGVGGLVERSTLPAEVQDLWNELDSTRGAYTKRIKVLEKIVNEHDKNFGTEHIYVTANQLAGHAMRIDRAAATKDVDSLNAMITFYAMIYEDFCAAIKRCDTVPLRLRTSPDGQKPETYVRATIKNDDNVLETLIFDSIIKDGQLEQISHPISLARPVTAGEHVELMEQEFFAILENTPGIDGFKEALSQKLLKDITSYLEHIDKKYGVALCEADPAIYVDFSLLRTSLGLDTGRGLQPTEQAATDMPEVTVVTDNIAHEKHGHDKTSGDISGCPYHQFKSKVGGILKWGQKDMDYPGMK